MNFKEKLPKYITQFIGGLTIAGIAIINPLLLLAIPSFLVPTFYIGNKIIYKGHKSDLFTIDRKNNITQKIGSNIFKTGFIKDKSNHFKIEMCNLLLDMKPNENYTTVSQALVLQSLKKLENLGIIDNLVYTEQTYKNKFSRSFNNYMLNLGVGNYNNLLKNNKKYNISFRRTDKVIDENIIENILQGNVTIIKNKKGIKKVKKTKIIPSSNSKEGSTTNISVALPLHETPNNLTTKNNLDSRNNALTTLEEATSSKSILPNSEIPKLQEKNNLEKTQDLLELKKLLLEQYSEEVKNFEEKQL